MCSCIMDDMQATPDGPPQTKTIDPSGDVLLKIGPSRQPSVKLLVNSRVLSFASPVFAAMFGGHFAEGQDLSSARPQEVSLPEDDPVSMEILCNIAHMKISEMPAEMEHTALADFAILCDKYRCIDTIRSFCRVDYRLAERHEPPELRETAVCGVSIGPTARVHQDYKTSHSRS